MTNAKIVEVHRWKRFSGSGWLPAFFQYTVRSDAGTAYLVRHDKPLSPGTRVRIKVLTGLMAEIVEAHD